VCLGNICRSPTAHGFFRDSVEKLGQQSAIHIDSAGTGDWHIGGQPDARATEQAAQHGVDLSDLRARQVNARDFDEYDYVLAMDNQNLADLRVMAPANYSGFLGLFLDFSESYQGQEMPDPYYGGCDGFELVVTMVEDGCKGLLADIQRRHRWSCSSI